MYIPIGIVMFVLLAQHKIMHAQAQGAQAQAQALGAQSQAQAKGSNQGKKDVFQELERLASLKQQGLISEEEFQSRNADYSQAFKTVFFTNIQMKVGSIICSHWS